MFGSIGGVGRICDEKNTRGHESRYRYFTLSKQIVLPKELTVVRGTERSIGQYVRIGERIWDGFIACPPETLFASPQRYMNIFYWQQGPTGCWKGPAMFKTRGYLSSIQQIVLSKKNPLAQNCRSGSYSLA